ncbi:MAG: undecaprenyl/decaprenyl-phosphate alpha-N-acetylglucosaminyl 1-phosphate transferase [Actinomycetia bacterium]|nr:undecaprenyl/decaprenyl-phosphate alpha-N-acetylglucosaminyl 1-phosphate transferase [Actinomycetes bacterium]
MREYLLCLFVAAAVTYLSTPFARRFAIKWGAVAEVRDRDVHSHPTPRLGGLGILAGLLAAILVASQLPLMSQVFQAPPGELPTEVLGLVAGMLVLVLVGMVDDRYGLDALSKFAGQVLAGGIIAYGGISISWLPINGVFILDPLGGVLITVFIVVFTVNAINFVDGLDGLATGISAIAAAAFFAYSYFLSVANGFDRATLPTLATAALVGACLGFLPHNFYRARLFMGDTGSMLLGLVLAASTVTLVGRVDPNAVGSTTLVPALLPLLIPIAVLAVPVLDVGLAVFRRTWKGRSPFEPDKEHLHHRIMEMGHSQTRAVLLLYGWAATVAGTFVALAFVPIVAALLVGAGMLAVVLTLLRSPPGRRINDERAEQVS